MAVNSDEMLALMHDAFNDVLLQVSKSGAPSSKFLAAMINFFSEEVANGIAQTKGKFAFTKTEADEIGLMFGSVVGNMVSKRLGTMHEDVSESLC